MTINIALGASFQLCSRNLFIFALIYKYATTFIFLFNKVGHLACFLFFSSYELCASELSCVYLLVHICRNYEIAES